MSSFPFNTPDVLSREAGEEIEAIREKPKPQWLIDMQRDKPRARSVLKPHEKDCTCIRCEDLREQSREFWDALLGPEDAP